MVLMGKAEISKVLLIRDSMAKKKVYNQRKIKNSDRKLRKGRNFY